jgi:hypothetical protein
MLQAEQSQEDKRYYVDEVARTHMWRANIYNNNHRTISRQRIGNTISSPTITEIDEVIYPLEHI